MELYYKNLISKDASLEKLVDDMMLVVQGAHAVADAAGTPLAPEMHQEVTTGLSRLKESCRAIKERAIVGARIADRVLHENPYSFAGVAFLTGLAVGKLIRRKS